MHWALQLFLAACLATALALAIYATYEVRKSDAKSDMPGNATVPSGLALGSTTGFVDKKLSTSLSRRVFGTGKISKATNGQVTILSVDDRLYSTETPDDHNSYKLLDSSLEARTISYHNDIGFITFSTDDNCMYTSVDGRTFSKGKHMDKTIISAACNGTVLVATCSDGRFITEDGVNWTFEATNDAWNVVLWVSEWGCFCAGDNAGVFHTATDVNNWTAVDSSVLNASPIRCACYHEADDSVYVFTLSGRIAKSSTIEGALTLSKNAMNGQSGFESCVSVGTYIVTSGYRAIVWSPDSGTTWLHERCTGSGGTSSYNAAAYDGVGRYVVVGDAGLYSGDSLNSLAPMVENDVPFTSVVYHVVEQKFIVGGGVGQFATVYTSSDGKTWAGEDTSAWAAGPINAAAYDNGIAVFCQASGNTQVFDGAFNEYKVCNEEIKCITVKPGDTDPATWVIGCTSGAVYVTQDPLSLGTWTQSTIAGFTDTVRCIAYGNGMFVLGSGASAIYSSTDAVTWTKQNNLENGIDLYSESCDALVFDGTQFILSMSGNHFFTSDDGLTWKFDGYLLGDVYNTTNTIFAVVDNTCLASSWYGGMLQKASIGPNKSWSALRPMRSEYRAVFSAGSNIVFAEQEMTVQTTDMISFDVTGSNAFVGAAVLSDRVVCIDGMGTVWESLDGVTFTKTGPNDGTLVHLTALSAIANDGLVAHSRSCVFYSGNRGRSWLMVKSAEFQSLMQDSSRNYIASSKNSGVIVASYDHVMHSKDGFEWTTVKMSYFSPRAVCADDNMFYIVAENGSDSSTLFYSQDGTTWTQRAFNLPRYNELRMIYDGNSLIAAGSLSNSGSYVAVSTDSGATWNMKTGVVAYGTSKFQLTTLGKEYALLQMQYEASQLFVSDDLVNWKTSSLGFTFGLVTGFNSALQMYGESIAVLQ